MAATAILKRSFLTAAVLALAPAGSVLAAQDPCEGDPFAPYHRSFFADGQYECKPAATRETGARGPAGPIMEPAERARARGPGARTAERASAPDDPFAPYRRSFFGD